MARVKITEFGVIQKALAGATVQIFIANDSGENTGVLAILYKAASGADRVTNPQTLDEEGRLSVDCYVDNNVIAEISNISDLAYRSLSRIKANPLEYPLGATNAAHEGASVSDQVAQAEAFADEAGGYAELIEEVFGGTSSTTSHSLSGGSKTFTIAAGLPFSVGQYVLITYNVSPTSNLMHGQITSYVGTALTVTIGFVTGSGTYSDWNIITSGPRGSKGDTGPAGSGAGDMLKSELLSGLSDYPTVRLNLGLGTAALQSSGDFATAAQGAKADQAYYTGEIRIFARSTLPTGWVNVAGGTIGDGSSGATERANADCLDLFTLRWNDFDNAEATIQNSSGVPVARGASAAADWAAHRRITLEPLTANGGSFIRAWDGTTRNIGSYQADEFKEHDHDQFGSRNNQNYPSGALTGFHNSGYTTWDTGLAGGDETRPKNIAYLIGMRL